MTFTSITKPRRWYGLGVLAFFILLGTTANLRVDDDDGTLYVFFSCAAAVLAFYYIAISYVETFEDR
ncbi:MAG: hypothetical protein ACO1PI_04955 [Bacteroidota bacterium]